MKTTAVKERPILMSARSVQGILAGRKCQTRRIIKPQPWINSVNQWLWDHKGKWQHAFHPDIPGNDATSRLRSYCPHGQPGDQLWVRETFYIDTVPTGRLIATMIEDVKREDFYYRADGECCDQIPECSCAEVGKLKWRPAIHMPRWASRLTLEITDIRVERVQDISAVDAKAEGSYIGKCECLPPIEATFSQTWCYAHGEEFKKLWDDTNGRGAWERNDWVWVIGFKSLT